MLTRPQRPVFPTAPAPPATGSIGSDPTGTDTRVVALTRGEERFVYLFRSDRAADCLARIAAHAADPTLSLTPDDAILLADRVREG